MVDETVKYAVDAAFTAWWWTMFYLWWGPRHAGKTAEAIGAVIKLGKEAKASEQLHGNGKAQSQEAAPLRHL